VTLWRISPHPDLDGTGGLRISGRWHTRGHRVVYCAPNPATALVEILVHIEIDREDLPDPLHYLEIEAPDSTTVQTLEPRSIDREWATNPDVTRHEGDNWLHSGRTALLRVPSVIVPATWNVLINPRHPDSARIRVSRRHAHAMDPRLLR